MLIEVNVISFYIIYKRQHFFEEDSVIMIEYNSKVSPFEERTCPPPPPIDTIACVYFLFNSPKISPGINVLTPLSDCSYNL